MLQGFIDVLFHEAKHVSRLDAVLRAEALDLPDELRGIIELLPPGSHARHQICNQLNSALKGHGWNSAYGTVE